MLSHARASVVAVVLVAFAVRAAALWAGANANLTLDEEAYALRAEALLDGEGFLGSYQSWVRHASGLLADLPQYPGAWQPPGQTVFMAAVMAPSGRSLLAVKLAQVLLGALSVLLVYALARAWFDHRHGLAAAWICALYPNLVAFTHYLWSETLFGFLLLAALWLLTRRREPPTARSALLGGALLGLGALTRGTLFYFLPLLLAWLVWAHRSCWRVALARAALVASIALLVVAPWSVRNTWLHGGFVLIETNGPYNLWRGNGADAFANRGDPRVPHYAWPFESLPLAPVGGRSASRLVEEAKQALGSEAPTDLQIIGYARDAAWQSIRSDPAAFFSRIRFRLIDMWNPTSFLIRHFRIGAYGAVPWPIEAAVTAAAALGYLLVMGLACAGFWLGRRRPEVWLVLLLVAFFSGLSAVAFGLTRFRLPLVPPLIVVASPAAVAVAGRLGRRPRRAASVAAALCALPFLLLPLVGCGEELQAPPATDGPNVLWVVWDTVRADHLSLYGHERKTTPRLDAWAQAARVFENATSTAGYTLPSHASMFTGLLPSEHCTHNGHQRLEDRYATIAELLRDAGYRTFLFSANPQISASPARNFGQGFEATEHPWSPRYRDAALELVQRKLPPEDRSSELPERLRKARRGEGRYSAWNIKAAGEIAERATLAWLDSVGSERPWFVFLNYMEAHRPYIPPRAYREQMMSEEEVRKSYRVDRSWLPMWEYTFGLREYSEEDLSLTRATYDATLRELDDLFAELLEALAQGGHLDDTIVILTSDHGEHLGEQHMLDHQYSLYQPLLRVPLVIHHPGRIKPGRDPHPVVNFDVFPTLLELVGLAAPGGSQAVSLLSPREGRSRLAEEPVSSQVGIEQVLAAHPGWDPSPYQRRLRALIDARYKYIWASDGRHELFDLAADPLETRNLVASRSEVTSALADELERRYAALQLCRVTVDSAQPRDGTPEERDMLEALGYLAEDDDRSR